MRILVTGGAGYIGSVLVEHLVAEGHDVTVLDSLENGHRDAVDPAAHFVKADLLDRSLVLSTLRERGVEAVIHLAAHSLVSESMTDPAKYYRANVTGSLALLDAMRETDVRRFVFSSSAAVYGEPDGGPIAEDARLSPTNTYGETKLAVERALPWYESAHGLRWMSLRYFNAAGATARSGERHEPETHLIPIALEAALGRRPEVVIQGDDYPTRDGTCVRDYIHVVDLARAHLLCLDALAAGRPSAVYNLGCGGEGYTVKEVLAAAERVIGRPIPQRVGPRRPGDPAVLVASSARIVRELGFSPKHQSLDEMIDSAFRFATRSLEPRRPT